MIGKRVIIKGIIGVHMTVISALSWDRGWLCAYPIYTDGLMGIETIEVDESALVEIKE